MTARQTATPVPGPLEAYAQPFADLLARRPPRDGCRRSLAGVLLAAERTKTLTARANAASSVGAQHAAVQSLQW